MKIPSFTAMRFADSQSEAAGELQFFHKPMGEITPLKRGDRVYFLTVEGEFPATVKRDWERPAGWPSQKVHIILDCRSDWPIQLNRALFRAFTILDHISLV